MAITFHCEYCGKEIRAADQAGGKWGKCPACHNKLYVPNLNINDELTLAPIDETEEEKKKRLMAETYMLTQDILQERTIPEGDIELPASTPSTMDEREITKRVILYLRQMADGELEDAEMTVAAIAPHSRQAKPIIDKIALSEIPEPELADLAPQVLAGLIRTLRSKIG
ncbi:MAG: hypothetical protein JW720_03945 [Sedimentisphaerales bacterium]|nr:hypothetical protein [Sedimentisphaerales bacterium]